MKKRVVIAGAGFAGLRAVARLSGKGFDITLIDRNNYHTFLPLLYQVAAAEIEPEEIAYPVRAIIRRYPDVDFLMARISYVDFAKRTIHAGDLNIAYDYLVLAMGSVTKYFKTPGAQEHCFDLKTLEEGVVLRNHILGRFELAYLQKDEEAIRRELTFVIVGAGPTGVEYSGALAELIKGPLLNDFSGGIARKARVILLEAGTSVLASFPEKLKEYSRRRLEEMGVSVRLGARVVGVTEDAVHLGDGEVIPTRTVVWTAGVKGESTTEMWEVPKGSMERLRTLGTLQLEAHPEVFAAGDLCVPAGDASPPPMIAPAAIQQGELAAENIIRHRAGQRLKEFKYRDKGSMAVIGRGAAAVRTGNLAFTGFLAWIIWLFIHLLYLVGFKNRLVVLINWAMDYLFFEKAVRLILPRCQFRKTAERDKFECNPS